MWVVVSGEVIRVCVCVCVCVCARNGEHHANNNMVQCCVCT